MTIRTTQGSFYSQGKEDRLAWINVLKNGELFAQIMSKNAVHAERFVFELSLKRDGVLVPTASFLYDSKDAVAFAKENAR